MSSRRVVLYCAYVAGVTITFLLVTAEMAAAHNCQNFTDCFASADAATDSLLGMTFLGMLSMGLDFVPYVGTAKGVVEAVTGRDLLTGEELSDAERLLGLVPGGLGHAGDVLSSTRHLDEMASVAGGGLRHGDELADAARHADDLPPPPPSRTPGSRRPYGEHDAPLEGRGPFSNRYPDELADDLARAERAGVRPVSPTSPQFDEVVNQGQIKWAVTADGELVVIPKNVPGHGEMPHTVLTGGDDVIAAGEAEIAGMPGNYIGAEITPHSGHFRPSMESLDVGREAFARFGITFP